MWPFNRKDDHTEELLGKIEELVRTKPDSIVAYINDGNGKLNGFYWDRKQNEYASIRVMVWTGGLTVRLIDNDKSMDYDMKLTKAQLKRVCAAIDYLFKEKSMRDLDRTFN